MLARIFIDLVDMDIKAGASHNHYYKTYVGRLDVWQDTRNPNTL